MRQCTNTAIQVATGAPLAMPWPNRSSAVRFLTRRREILLDHLKLNVDKLENAQGEYRSMLREWIRRDRNELSRINRFFRIEKS